MQGPLHTIPALLLARYSFYFAEDATTAAAARTAGYRYIGNGPSMRIVSEAAKVDHIGSYGGTGVQDYSAVTNAKVEYELTLDEINYDNLMLLFHGDTATGFTQAAKTVEAVDTIDFSSVTWSKSKLHPLMASSALLRQLSLAVFTTEAPVSVTVTNSTDVVAESNHTRVAGDAVVVSGTAAPAGLTKGGIYYVRDVVALTSYKLAATPGGDAINMTTDGTSVTVAKALVPETDYHVVLRTGMVQFLTSQTGVVRPIVSCPAITTSGTYAMLGITPFTNPARNGIGRLVIEDGYDADPVFADHEGFPCDLSIMAGPEINGQDWANFQLRVSLNSKLASTIYQRIAASQRS